MATRNVLTVKEAARTLRVSERSILRYIKAKKLHASKIGQWRIKRSDLDKFFRKHANSTSRKRAKAKK